jgi:DNA mismatch repair protein MLH1
MEPDAADSAGTARDHQRIRRLPEHVVNRIAAGEVVVSPAAALKELLENCLDAGASTITVSVRGGGAKLLRVCDDGKGIPVDDLPLLCSRFATSKLRTFEDLREVSTFGFRGEALASVSHVARVSVLTKTKSDTCAHTAKYLDGVLVASPAASAGLDGTTLTVEDLFYNLPTRLRGLRPAGEEYRAIVDVVTRYSIKYHHVAFVCRRLPEGSATGRAVAKGADVRTVSDSSAKENIRAAFGAFVGQELLDFDLDLAECGIKARGIATNPGFSMKKGIFILFINGRLVECGPLKRAIECSYSPFLPKGGHSFVFLDVIMRAADIDVNVHPNKKEVRFLWERNLIDAVTDILDAKLKSDGKSRTFLAQALISQDGALSARLDPRACNFITGRGKRAREHLADPEKPGSPPIAEEVMAPIESDKRRKAAAPVTKYSAHSLIDFEAVADEDDGDEEGQSMTGDDQSFIDDRSQTQSPVDEQNEIRDLESDESDVVQDTAVQRRIQGSQDAPQCQASNLKPTIIAQKDKVHTSHKAPSGTMDAFVHRSSGPSSTAASRQRRQRRANAIAMLTSMQEAIADLGTNAHEEARNILRCHVFVGVVSDQYALIQHQTKLLLIEVAPVLAELLYRQILMRIADMDFLRLDPPAPLVPLVNLGLANEDNQNTAVGTEVSPAVCACIRLLIAKASMLDEYFSIKISGSTVNDAVLEQIPLIFDGMSPDLARMPELLLGLVDIDWTCEQPCLLSIARLLADCYKEGWKTDVQCRGIDNIPDSTRSNKSPHVGLLQENEWYLKHVLFESLRHNFDPPEAVARAIREVTSTQKLYKIFERC